MPGPARPDPKHHVVLFDLLHVAPLVGTARRDRLLPELSRLSGLARIENLPQTRPRIRRRHLQQIPDRAIVHAPAGPHQVVVLSKDVHCPVHLPSFAFNRQLVILQVGRDFQGRFEQLEVFIERAKEVFYLPGNLDGTFHGERDGRSRRRYLPPFPIQPIETPSPGQVNGAHAPSRGSRTKPTGVFSCPCASFSCGGSAQRSGRPPPAGPFPV